MDILRGVVDLIIDIRGSTSNFPPQPWIPGIPLDSLEFPGIPGYSGNSRGPFLEMGIPGNYPREERYSTDI